MKKLLTITLTFLYFTSFSQAKTSNKHGRSGVATTSIDTSIIAILPYSKILNGVFTNCTQATLSSDDVEKLEKILIKCIKKYNILHEKDFEKDSAEHPNYKLNKNEFVIDLKRYKRQYVAVFNSKGQKEVWINCLCQIGRRMDWKKEIPVVHDGGSCFFNLKINLTTRKYYDFEVNGVG